MSTTSSKNSRQAILDRLRSISVPPVQPFQLPADQVVRYDDLLGQFIEVAQAVGAQVHLADTAAQIAQTLQGDGEFAAASNVCSLVPEVQVGNFDTASLDDPHQAAPLDWLVAAAQFAVAENGAVWVQPPDSVQRAMLFLTQHLVLVVSRSQLVPHMHDAYRRVRDSWTDNAEVARFGVFIAGPSKTADIEQSLVIGAHGCRSLQLFLLP